MQRAGRALFVVRVLDGTGRAVSGDQDGDGQVANPPAVPDHMKGRDLRNFHLLPYEPVAVILRLAVHPRAASIFQTFDTPTEEWVCTPLTPSRI